MNASLISCYKSTLDELEIPYVFPQEYGNLSDLRYALFSTGENLSLKITALSEPLNVSAWNYSMEKIQASAHGNNLIKDSFITLNIDHRLTGLGSKSFGQDVLEEHKVHFEDFNYRFSLELR